MDELTDEKLRFAYESLHRSALGSGQGIYNAFSLSMAGLLVLLGGVIASENITLNLKITIGIAVPLIGILICCFMRLQRNGVVKCVNKMREIEKKLNIDTVLPEDYSRPIRTHRGFTKADWTQIIALAVLVITIIVTLLQHQ